MQFDEVQPQHFSTIARTPFPHILIERALIQLAGDKDGAKFRNDALAAAGWFHTNLTPFGKHPELACTAFNRIREVLTTTEVPEDILEALKSLAKKEV